MNTSFLIGPSTQLQNDLNESPNSSGVGEVSYSSRRTFIKRAGLATLATVVAFNVETALGGQDYPWGEESSSFLMVCTYGSALQKFDSGTKWDGVHGVDYGTRLHFDATGPSKGDAVRRGGKFHLAVTMATEGYRRGPFTMTPSIVGHVDCPTDQTVRFGGSGVEFDPATHDNPQTSAAGGDIVEGNSKFDSGSLNAVGIFTGSAIPSITIGGGPISITLPTAGSFQLSGSASWSFSIMTFEEYKNEFGKDPSL